jgi:ferritin
MISKKIEDALNQQITDEYYSSYLYLSMSAHCQVINMTGCAHWLRLQAQEELGHALKIFDYLLNRGGRAVLGEIKKPPTEWNNSTELFEAVLAHEQLVTSKINDLVQIADDEKDRATHAFLQWFVTEQVEEESTADEILHKFKLVGDNGSGLLMIDTELGSRPGPVTNAFTGPAAQ